MPSVQLDPVKAFDSAISAYQDGRFADVERLCEHVLTVQREHFDAAHLLAAAQIELGKYEAALGSYDRALGARPNSAEALTNRGVALERLRRFSEALVSYDRALALQPDFGQAWHNRGNVLQALARFDEALVSYDRAHVLMPQKAEVLYNRGNVLHELKRYEQALASYDRSIVLRPQHADAYNNRGQVLRELRRYDEAVLSYDAALALQPQHVGARCNGAAVRLMLGQFERGWADYEWRWKKSSVAANVRNFLQPLWRGEDIVGKTIFLHSEQGFGDTIQFCRYVPLVAERGARVVFEVQEPLRALMMVFADIAQVIGRGEPLPTFDVHCPLLSLPLAFGTRLDTIPVSPAYLKAPSDRAELWRSRLKAYRFPLLGLVWSGRPAHERDRERSIPLRSLLPLLQSEATFVSLQKEVREVDAITLKAHPEILQVADELNDFSDTAALISQVDLLISVDTSVAHLAAALGKPTWFLLPDVPDFRWLLGRDDSPWYPSARLFRQDHPRNWEDVIGRVRSGLRAFTAGHTTRVLESTPQIT